MNHNWSRLIHCEVPLKGLLVLALSVLGGVLVGLAPASAYPTVLDWAVVRGTDNHVYVASYSSGGWSGWQALGGSTFSSPGVCEAAGLSTVYVFVRGTDNGVYVNGWTSSSGWSGSWVSPPGGGRTIDAPACAYLDGFLHVVVRGMNNELYWNSWAGGWVGWVDLHGKSISAPVLVSTPSLDRIDLVVQGADNGIYHKSYTGSPPSGTWSSWDGPGGKTSSKPAIAFYFERAFSVNYESFFLVVRGTDNKIYRNRFHVGGSWEGWGSYGGPILSGVMLSAPTFVPYDNGCTPGSTVANCNSIDALAVRGTNNALYHNTYSFGAWSGWDSPGGSIANSPALAYIPGTAAQFLLLVEGYSNNNLYSNTVTGATWGTWMGVGGATNSDPALVAVL